MIQFLYEVILVFWSVLVYLAVYVQAEGGEGIPARTQHWTGASSFTDSRPTLVTEFLVRLVNMGLVSVDIAIGVVCIIIFCIQIR